MLLPLGPDVMENIVILKLSRVSKKLKENQNLIAEFTKPVIKEIVTSCTRGETGARNIDAIIDRRIIPEISEQLLGFMADEKVPSNLKVGKDKSGNFTYKFS